MMIKSHMNRPITLTNSNRYSIMPIIAPLLIVIKHHILPSLQLGETAAREIYVASAGRAGGGRGVGSCVLEAVDRGECILLEGIRVDPVCALWILT
jgi:hypothetical protein